MKKKRMWYTIFIIIGLFILIKFISPVAFVKDGIVTKIKVDDFQKQYNDDLERIRRHNASKMKNVYLFNLGFKKPQVESEGWKEKVEVEQIAPFLYKWKFRLGSSAYKVTIGNQKYYFAYLCN